MFATTIIILLASGHHDKNYSIWKKKGHDDI